ncbi:MAG: hypothetical protein ABJA90_09750 [Ginsengibacter sp.]
MSIIITPRNKNQEKIVKAFLSSLDIRYHSEMEEDAGLFRAMQKGRKSRLLSESEKGEFIKRLKQAN